MIEAVSCGGVVIFRGKILLLYKNYRNKYEGWVLPKGTVEPGEEFKDTALREVLRHQICREERLHLQRAGRYGGKRSALVSDDGRQLLQQAAARRVFYGFGIL